MRIIEQPAIIGMLVRANQTLANLRTISDAVAHGRCDVDGAEGLEGLEDVIAALSIVRVNGERVGREARLMLRSINAVAEAGYDTPPPAPQRSTTQPGGNFDSLRKG